MEQMKLPLNERLIRLARQHYTLLIVTTCSMLFPFFIGSFVWLSVIIYLMWRHRKQLVALVHTTGWVGVGVAFGAVIALINRNYIGVLAAGCFFLVMLFFIIYPKLITPKLYLNLLNIIAIGSIGTSILSIAQYFQYIYYWHLPLDYIISDPNPGYRAMATLFNANYYGLYCVFAILIALYLLFKTRHLLLRLGYLISICLNLIGIFLTASRMVLPALALSGICFVFFLNPKIGKWLVGALLLGIMTLMVFPMLIPRSSSVVSGLTEREWIWSAAWKLFEHYPLTGRGPLSYAMYFYLYEGKGQPHAHQLILELLSSYGLIGVFFFVMGMVTYFRQRLALVRDRVIKLEVGLVFAMITAVLVHGLMDVSVMWIQTGYIFLIVVMCPIKLLQQIARTDLDDFFTWRNVQVMQSERSLLVSDD